MGADLRYSELFPLGKSVGVMLVSSLFKQYSRTWVYLSVVALVFPSRLLHIHSYIVFIKMNMNVRMLSQHLHTKKTRKHLCNGHSFQTQNVDL